MTKTISAVPKKILNRKFENGKKFYHVEWTTKSGGGSTWEPAQNIDDYRPDIVELYDLEQSMGNASLGSRKACGIARVSTAGQVDPRHVQGHTSLHSQSEEIRSICREKNWQLMEIAEEVKSAKNIKRNGALQHIVSIASPGSVLVFYDVSRFSRDFVGAVNLLEGEIKRKRLTIYSILENATYEGPAGRHIFRGLLATSAFYSELTSQKIKRSVDRRRTAGHVFGPAKFGFSAYFTGDKIRKFKRNADEQKVIKMILDDARQNNTNSNGIVELLTGKNVTIRGRRPTASFVRGITKRYR